MSQPFRFFSEVIETDVGLRAIGEAMRELKELETLVGVPQNTNARADEVSNAELLYIHTNGSPLNGIPARPVIEPAIENGREQIASMLKKAVDVALDGNKAAVKPALEKAGIQGENLAKAWFQNPANGWAANLPATVREKGSTFPLIDTSALRNSITHVVEKV